MIQYHIQFACSSHIGRLRSNHEDNFWCDHLFLPEHNCGISRVITGKVTSRKNRLFAVFDGMGGEEAGEAAAHISALIMENHADRLESPELQNIRKELCELFYDMNQAVIMYRDRNKLFSMGSTAAAAFFQQDSVYFANIGDSRIYRMRNRRLEQMSKDHIILNPFTGRRDLTQCLGIDPEEMKIEPYISREEVRTEDQFLLCSDGLTDMIENQMIAEILDGFGAGRTQACVSALQKCALEHGGRDNITLILCEVV